MASNHLNANLYLKRKVMAAGAMRATMPKQVSTYRSVSVSERERRKGKVEVVSADLGGHG